MMNPYYDFSEGDFVSRFMEDEGKKIYGVVKGYAFLSNNNWKRVPFDAYRTCRHFGQKRCGVMVLLSAQRHRSYVTIWDHRDIILEAAV